MTTRAQEITLQLMAASIPIDGVSIDQLGEGPNVTIQFRPEATKSQQDQAKVIVDNFKAARPRRKKAIAAIVAEIRNLPTAQDRNRVYAWAAAELLADNPKALQKLGIAIDGDEEV